MKRFLLLVMLGVIIVLGIRLVVPPIHNIEYVLDIELGVDDQGHLRLENMPEYMPVDWPFENQQTTTFGLPIYDDPEVYQIVDFESGGLEVEYLLAGAVFTSVTVNEETQTSQSVTWDLVFRNSDDQVQTFIGIATGVYLQKEVYDGMNQALLPVGESLMYSSAYFVRWSANSIPSGLYTLDTLEGDPVALSLYADSDGNSYRVLITTLGRNIYYYIELDYGLFLLKWSEPLSVPSELQEPRL